MKKIKKSSDHAVKKSAKALIPKFDSFNRHDVMLKPGKETLTDARYFIAKDNYQMKFKIISLAIIYCQKRSVIWITTPNIFGS